MSKSKLVFIENVKGVNKVNDIYRLYITRSNTFEKKDKTEIGL